MRRDIGRFVIFLETGTVNRDNPLKGAMVELLPYFQQLTDAYLESDDFHPNTRNDMRKNFP
ncbi:hypothetical protein FACS189499_07900 [Clostridia bacterium]|nr:hypothetical protein FACS189499_07900 [Clostridia bacterium]